jgi:hypothetical protein
LDSLPGHLQVATFFLGSVAACIGHAEGLLNIDNPARNGSTAISYAHLEAFEGNDQISMRQYGDGWQGNYSPRRGTNLALQSVNTEAGFQSNGYRLGAKYRGFALVESNRDSSDLVRQFTLTNGYDNGRAYIIDYKLRGFEAGGARLSKSFQSPPLGGWQIKWGVGGSALHAKSIKVSNASGNVTTVNTKDFNAAINLTTTTSQIDQTNLTYFNAPFGHTFTPSGELYAVDFGLVLTQEHSSIEFEFAVNDAYGQMNWRNLPRNTETFNSDNKFYDNNGFVQFNPTSSRISEFINPIQQLDPKIWVALTYPFGKWRIRGAASSVNGYWFPEMQAAFSLNKTLAISGNLDFHFKTIGLSIKHEVFEITIQTDSLDSGNARAIGVAFQLTIPLN